MKNILFVTDTYYPDSSATTTLSRRNAEALAQLGYHVDVYPAEITNNHYTYPDAYNGVNIIAPEPGSNKDNAPVKASEDHQITQKQVEALSRVLQAKSYDAVFSVAIAFEVNFLTHQALAHSSSCKVETSSTSSSTSTSNLPKWYPMAYDPYAFDPHVTPEQRKNRIKLEVEALKDATKIFFLTEFKEDYIGSPIENKIEWFMLPCIRPIHPDRTKKAITFDSSYINCVFLGDFYYGVENTDFIFRLFEKLTTSSLNSQLSALSFSTPIRLYTVGNLCDFKPTVDLWKNKLGENYICHERVSQEEAHNVMLDCDMLVSMGHDSANMCPSKIIDFISSGKPILHISKIPDCCGEKYLQKYPHKTCIYQNEELTDARVKEIEQFIFNAKSQETMPFDAVKALYSDFTMEALIEKIQTELNEK